MIDSPEPAAAPNPLGEYTSYVTNCYFVPRAGDAPLFLEAEGLGVFARLNRYAVIPIEEYRRLARRARHPISDAVKALALLAALVLPVACVPDAEHERRVTEALRGEEVAQLRSIVATQDSTIALQQGSIRQLERLVREQGAAIDEATREFVRIGRALPRTVKAP